MSAAASGMTLRDWFAGQALPSIVSAACAGQHMPQMPEGERHVHFALARDAYDMADAMLVARGLPPRMTADPPAQDDTP